MRGLSFYNKTAGNKLSRTQSHHIALNHNADQNLVWFLQSPVHNVLYAFPGCLCMKQPLKQSNFI